MSRIQNRPARTETLRALHSFAIAAAAAAYVMVPGLHAATLDTSVATGATAPSLLDPGDQYERYGYHHDGVWGAGCGAENYTRSPTFSTATDIPLLLEKFAEYTAMPEKMYGPGPWTNWSQERDMRNSLAKLSTMRNKLEAENLWDTYRFSEPARVSCPSNSTTTRTIDGSCNDPEQTWMGQAGTRFGRMMDPTASHSQGETATLLHPDPRQVSRVLLTRDSYKEVPFLNLLAASWIQFMVHDWFRHTNSKTAHVRIPLRANDPLRRHGQKDMVIPLTAKDPSRQPHEAAMGPTFQSETTHWWDGSQIYGSDVATANRLRTFEGGRLKMDPGGLLPKAADGFDDAGFRHNWWIGLALMHNLFANEHNRIAGELAGQYPWMNDQELYDKARMITGAIIAKIHTIEWTPAILPNPSLTVGMNVNWAGLNQYMDPPLPPLDGRIPAPYRHVFWGIRGGPRSLYKDPGTGKQVPFAMTEEFVSVYRMHPLLPDAVKVKDLATEAEVATYYLEETLNADARQLQETYGVANLLYSFGTEKPGQLVLNNYPRFLQGFGAPGARIDLGAVDVLRDRERGVPRYNEFRRQLNLLPLSSIDEITSDPELVAKLKEVYGSDAGAIERVDTFIGTLAEGYRPRCYGFGETLFQVFTAIATRRLHGDLYYTSRYNADSYTAHGLKLIEEATFKDILLRHYPALASTDLQYVTNPFFPWSDADAARLDPN